MTEQHEWKLRFIHGKVMADSHDKDGKYLKTLFADEIESRLNEYETLKRATEALTAELAREIGDCLYAGIIDHERKSAVLAYADILEE